MTLNLKSEEGRAIFMKLAEKADVIVENYRSDVKHRLKIDYEAVRKVNPRIVYGSISGFGQSRPGRDAPRRRPDRAGHGRPDVDHRRAGQRADARRHSDRRSDRRACCWRRRSSWRCYDRERTGDGQWVHTSLLEAQIFMLDFQASRWLMKGEVAKQAGNDHPTAIPTGVFPTSGRLHQHRRLRRQAVGARLRGARRQRR